MLFDYKVYAGVSSWLSLPQKGPPALEDSERDATTRRVCVCVCVGMCVYACYDVYICIHHNMHTCTYIYVYTYIHTFNFCRPCRPCRPWCVMMYS